MKTVVIMSRSALCAVGLVFASPAFAETAPTLIHPREFHADLIADAAQQSSQASSQDDAVIGADELESLSGGTGVSAAVLTQQDLNAFNSGNVVSGVTVGSGQINIGSNAFSGFDGVGNFVLNTGHNNNLQSNLSVSIVLAP